MLFSRSQNLPMNIFRRFTAATFLLLLAALPGAAAPASVADTPRGKLEAPTVEPTLPLVLDLSLEGVEKVRGGVEARLILDFRPLADLVDVVIRPILPPEVIAGDDDAVPERLARLTHGPA